MFRLIKNIFNAAVIVLVFVGISNLYNNHFFDDVIANTTNFFDNMNKKTESQIGDFSHINPEYNIDSAVNLFGYKTLFAEHQATGQRFIVVNSGKKTLLTVEDIKSDSIDKKLEDLSKKFKYQSTSVSDIKILEKGYINSYGKKLPYVKISASVTKLPIKNVTALVAVNDTDPKKQRLLVTVNEKRRYSQLITSEFYKSIKEVR